MNKTSRSSLIKVWAPVIIYILIIFALTPFLPEIIKSVANILNLTIKQFIIWLRNVVIVGLALFLIAFMIYQGRYMQQSTYVALVIIFAWGGKLVAGFGSPAEATHFLEYGGLAVLIFYKLRNRFLEIRSAPLYMVAALLTITVGVLDELYQGWLPAQFNRYYDFNDIVINASSGILGLIYVWGVMRPGPLRQRVKSILKGGHKGADFPMQI
jgi:hypothetical protein